MTKGFTKDELLSQHDCKAEKCSTCLMVEQFVQDHGTGEDGFHEDEKGFYINDCTEGENGENGAYSIKKLYLNE